MRLAKPRAPLPQRLRQLYGRYVRHHSGRNKYQNSLELETLITEFEAASKQLELASTEDLIPHLGDVIKKVFNLTQDGVKLSVLFNNSESRAVQDRGIGDVRKVANYWRICLSLAWCSRSYRKLFANAWWEPVPKYNPSTTSKLIGKQYVHAEVQLLVYYELSRPTTPPRVIGSSKEACFLCDSFIRAHGGFCVSGAHRQMFSKWTVPDLNEYSLPTLDKFRRALALVAADVRREYDQSKTKTTGRQLPVQSVVNVHAVYLETSSTSILSRRSQRPSVTETVQSISYSTETLQQLCSQVDGVDLQRDNPSVGAKPQNLSPNNILEHDEETENGLNESTRPQEDNAVQLEIDERIPAPLNWVQIQACFSRTTPRLATKAQLPTFQRGSVHLEPPRIDDGIQKIRLDDLSQGQEIILARGHSEPLDELAFVLIGSQGQAIGVRCRWHGRSGVARSR